MIKSKLKQLGQGMTEYIIIVALIAIAAIAIYGLFGDTIRGQMGQMTQELAGDKSAGGGVTVDTTEAAKTARGLNDYGKATK